MIHDGVLGGWVPFRYLMLQLYDFLTIDSTCYMVESQRRSFKSKQLRVDKGCRRRVCIFRE
jgi:hypothetical protein